MCSLENKNIRQFGNPKGGGGGATKISHLWEYNVYQESPYTDSPLWVKSGNRGNLKCLKVNQYFAHIFHRKMFISFLSDTKLAKVND